MNVTLPISQHAHRFPRKPAVIFPRHTLLSYGELDAILWRAVNCLRDDGLKPGDRAGLSVANPLLHLVTALAMSRLGVAYHAIATDDGPATVNAMQDRIGARVVVSETTLADITHPQIRISGDRIVASSTRGAGDFGRHADQLWRFAKSSGTTGRPKLFAFTETNLATMMSRCRMSVPICSNDVSLILVNLSFLSSTRRIFQDLAAGATVVLMDTVDADAVAESIRSAGINRLYAGPWLLPSLLARRDLDASFRRVSVIESSGSTVSIGLRRAVLERYTGGLTVNYGTNEMNSISTAIGQQCLSAPDTVGWPVPRGEVQIVDDNGQPLGPGVVGRVRVRDSGMVSSYWDDDAASRAAFRDGWFHPGDLAAWSERGEILFKGRADDMIILDGINIYPAEIENCLMQHPAVAEAVAFGLAHSVHGAVPVAAVRLSAGVGKDELVGFCRERMGVRYPRVVLALADFPRNARGKPATRELAKLMRFTDGTS